MGPNNRMGGRMGGRGMGSAGLLMNGLFQQERLAVLAQALGMSADELQKALTAGQTPHQLAEAKGMTVEAFQAALQTAAEAHLQQAVKDGRITQAQADALRQRVTEIDPFLGGRNGRGPASIPMLGALRGEMPTIMAETLGMTVDELTTARQQGKTIGELAEEKGLDATELRTAFLKVLDTHLKEAVSAGKLTQAQADAIRQQMAEHDFVGRGRW
jgi:AraC-like DNA-binding protein